MAKIGCAKCGGTKKMALGGSAVKKAPVQLYGIPQENMGTSSQMGFGRKGGTLNEMARGGTKKSTASKAVQAASRKVLANKALAARTAGANKANAGKIASKSNLPAKTVKPGLPAKTVKVAAKVPVKAPAKVLTIAQMKALEVAKKASTGSKVVGTGLKVASKVPAKIAKINFTEIAKKGGKNWKKLAGYTALAAGAYALDSYKNSKTTKPAAKPKVKPGTNTGALSKMVTPNKVGDNVKVTPKPVAKSSGSTKKYTSPNTGTTTTINTKPNGEKQTKVTTYAGQSFYKSTHVNPKGSPLLDKVKKAAEDTKGNKAGDGSSLKRPTNLKPITKTDTNANGTKTTIYIDASGNRHVKVVKKDGTTFTSNDKPKVATTPKVETKKTTPKVTAKVADKVSDEVTKMETKRPSAIETKNPADLKIIEPASKASSTSSSSTSSSSAPTTVPRANLINKVKSNINASRERRAERAESRGNNDRATKLRDKEKATQAKMMKKGGSVKSFPDLNKDGKVTKADILKGRGIIKKKGGVVKTKKK